MENLLPPKDVPGHLHSLCVQKLMPSTQSPDLFPIK